MADAPGARVVPISACEEHVLEAEEALWAGSKWICRGALAVNRR